MFDLVADPTEQKNLSNDPAQKAKFDELKAELLRLKKAFKDDDQFSTELPKDGVDGEFADRKRLGVKTIAEAIKLSVAK
jgi:hypothetical protein